jgi:hypothetical protein
MRRCRVGSHDEQAHWAAVHGSRAHCVLGPAVALPRVDAELELDDERPERGVAVEQENDDIGAVLGGLDLGQVDRDQYSGP